MRLAGLGLGRFLVSGALLAVFQFACRTASAQVVADSPQQANQRIQEASKSLQTIHFSRHEYVIGSGDVLSVEVFDVKELSRDVRVNQTGTISLPLVSTRLQMSGLTELQAQRKIAEVLEAEGLVSHPQVTVTVKEHRSKPITIVGAVSHPMVYQADGPVSLIEVLAEAGGIANDAGDTVVITRPIRPLESGDSSAPGASDSAGPLAPGEPPSLGPEGDPAAKAPASSATQSQVASSGAALASSAKQGAAADSTPSGPSHASNAITVNLNELVEKGDSSNNILLQAGDIVTVPHAGIVYVLGAVGRPGGFVLANDRSQMTALKMLALAGGLTTTAKSGRAVIIRKDTQGQEHEVALDLKRIEKRQAEDVALLPSDIVYVPESGAKSTLLRAASVGVAIGTGIALYRLAYR